jgi:predicted glycosyltransferase
MGLGHIRRNLLVARALADSHLDVDILLISGAREVGGFSLPPGVDCLVLPSLYKEKGGSYRSRHLGLSLQEVVSLRSKILFAAVADFSPDILIADNVARGAMGELIPVLDCLQSQIGTRCVLGLRDLHDSPDTVADEWRKGKIADVLRDYYQQIWIYGDAAVYDPVKEYCFPADIADKVRFLGYFDQRKRLVQAPGGQQDCARQPYILCMVGGGQDGAQLAETFVRARLPHGMQGVLLCGPHMDPAVRLGLHQSALSTDRLEVLDFIPEPARLIEAAAAVVCMGGYNSVCEVMSFDKRALIVPRVQPRQEQLIRAQRLSDLGLVEMLSPDRLSPGLLGERLEQLLTRPLQGVHRRIDFGAIDKLPGVLEQLLCVPSIQPLSVSC